MLFSQLKLSLAERGFIPDAIIRWGIRNLCQKRLLSETRNLERGITRNETLDIAVETAAANAQHYEVPALFYELVLGSNKKYSCCWWNDETETLKEAEANALARTADNAAVEDGMEILDLGCGWGALTLWLVDNFPNVKITSVSNSNSQREYITQRLSTLGKANRVDVITNDINDFEPGKTFDRIISIEMMEHIRNHSRLFENISSWLVKDGQVLTHVFAHKTLSYDFDPNGADDWMAKYFFTGGMMPSHSTLPKAAKGFQLVEQDIWPGKHYESTSMAWLRNMDMNKSSILNIFQQCYKNDYMLWWNRWRMFFLAVAELFGYSEGNEWGVVQQRFQRETFTP